MNSKELSVTSRSTERQMSHICRLVLDMSSYSTSKTMAITTTVIAMIP